MNFTSTVIWLAGHIAVCIAALVTLVAARFLYQKDAAFRLGIKHRKVAARQAAFYRYVEAGGRDRRHLEVK
jgi:hypothetical protein